METPQSRKTRMDAVLAAARESMERVRAAEAYAGQNCMAHHAPPDITKPGFAGAEQMFAQLSSVELPKYMAGAALVNVRLNRALGSRRGALIALDRAASLRREAYRRSLAR